MTEDEALAASLGRLAERMFGEAARVSGLERLTGGASQEIWSFDIDTEDGRRPSILRRNPGGHEVRQAAAGMATEARLIGLAKAAGAPVPVVTHVLTPADGMGCGFIMERVAGETLAPRILRDSRYARARETLAFQLGAAAARVHSIEVAAAGPLRVAMAADCVRDAAAQYRSQGGDRPVMAWALRWLKAHLPADEAGPVIVHGDMRNGNIVVGEEGLRALLDWEAVHVGDPAEDLGYACVTSWRFGRIDKPVGGFGSRESLFAGYESAGGRPVDRRRVRFWEVLGTLRWGLICGMMAEEFRVDGSLEKGAIGRRQSEAELDLLSILAPRWNLSDA